MNTMAVAAEVEYWDKIGETTRWGRYLAEREKSVILRGQALARPGRSVDVGCGGGRWSKLLSDLGWETTCTDVSEHSLQACQRKIPTARCVLAAPSDQRIPCQTKSQRLMVLIEVPAVAEADWLPSEAERVLEDSGIVVGTYMNPNSWRAAIWRMRRSAPAALEIHYAGPTYPDFKTRMERHRFEFLYEESFTWAPFGRESDSPMIPVMTKLERWLGLSRAVRFGPWILFIAKKRAGANLS